MNRFREKKCTKQSNIIQKVLLQVLERNNMFKLQ
jgi:hypothetical protein